DRRADHAQAQAGADQRRLRSDEARRVHPLHRCVLTLTGKETRMSTLELLSEHACFGGVQRFYRHASGAIGLPMQFGVFLPPQALHGDHKVPVLFYLAGLTCTEETFAIKAGAQQHAARLGLAIVTPDTSPR